MEQFPVLLTFDLDDELSTRNAFKQKGSGITDPELGQFGLTEGYRNVLSALGTQGFRGTFFVVGDSLSRHPRAIEQIATAGHNLGNHSFSHVSYTGLSESQLEDQISSAAGAIRKFTGQAPLGHRSPYWHPNPHLISVLLRLGVRWNADAHSSREELPLSSYLHTPSLVEVPSAISQGDWTNFLRLGLSAPQVFELWKTSLQRCRQHADVFTLVCHPFIIGQPDKLLALELFLEFLAEERESYRVVTGDEFAKEKISGLSASANA